MQQHKTRLSPHLRTATLAFLILWIAAIWRLNGWLTTPTQATDTKPNAAATQSAQTTTLAQTATTATDEATTRNLRERIERIVEDKQDQIKGVLTELQSKRRSTVGEIQRVTEDSLTIRTRKGTEIVPLSNTTYSITLLKETTDRTGKKSTETIKTSDIAVGSWALVMGIIENDSFQPIRIITYEESLRPRTAAVTIGNITTVSRTVIEIESRMGSETFSYTTNNATVYQDLEGNEIERTAIDESTQAIIVGYIQESNNSGNNSTAAANTAGQTNQRIAQIVRILTVL